MLSVGLDIAKEKIDFYSDGKHAQFKNDKKSITAHFGEINRKCKIVMEATGKYHRLAHEVLSSMGFKVMVINPYQSKHYAKALNLICKTDKVDASILCSFAGRMDFKATPYAGEIAMKLQDLSRHLDDLKKLRTELDLRDRESDGFISKSLKKTIKTIEKEIALTEKALKDTIKENEALEKSVALLQSIPGLGESTAIYLLSYLRELGTLNKREIAALCGLAPMNNESGNFKGKRRIRGGRHDVRSHLYMPILGAATQHNKRLKIFYSRLVDAGKPKKVALTACMRKLVIWANTMLKTGEPWSENYAKNH